MRYIFGYLVFIALRLGLTVAVGWVALDYLNEEFGSVAETLSLVAASLNP